MMLKKVLAMAGLVLVVLIGCGRKPLTPAAPWTDIVDDSLYFLAATTDPSGLGLEYTFDWGDGQIFKTRRYPSGETAYARYSLYGTAWHEIRVQARNENGKSSAWSAPLRFRKSKPPVIADDSIAGPVRWAVSRWYRASVQVTDPDGDSVSVEFIWDGNGDTTWTVFAPSGATFVDSCLWTATGPHMVSAVARDKGNMVARPQLAKTVSVSGMAVVWENYDEELYYTATPTLGSLNGEPVLYCVYDSLDCFTLQGRRLWSAPLGCETYHAPSLTADGERLYVCDDSGVCCLDARTGRRIWSLVLPEPADCTPAIGPDNSVYVVACDWVRELCRVRDCGDSGVVEWTIPLGDMGAIDDGAVVGRNGNIYAMGYDCLSERSFLVAVDPGGNVLWKDSARIQDGGIPVIDGQDRVVVSDLYGYVYCYNPDGSLAWSAATAALCPNSNAIGRNDDVIVTDTDGNVTCLDAAGGLRWSLALNASGSTTPCVAEDNTIIVYDAFGHVLAIGDDGGVLWDFAYYDSLGLNRRIPRRCDGYDYPSPVIGPNGDLYLVDECCGLMCIAHGGLKMANTAWPTYNHDNAHSGWAGRQQR